MKICPFKIIYKNAKCLGWFDEWILYIWKSYFGSKLYAIGFFHVRAFDMEYDFLLQLTAVRVTSLNLRINGSVMYSAHLRSSVVNLNKSTFSIQMNSKLFLFTHEKLLKSVHWLF